MAVVRAGADGAVLGGLHSGAAIGGVLITGVMGYAWLALLHPQRQFWHDAACGTRLMHWKAAGDR